MPVANGELLDEVRQAVDRGDWPTTLRLIGDLPGGKLSGPEGVVLLRTAVRAGDAHTTDVLAMCGSDTFASWPEGGDAWSWAADHGDLAVLHSLLTHRGARDTALMRAALEAAVAWLAVDPETELRRRLGAPNGGSVDREPVYGDSGRRDSTRIRLTLPDGRSAQIMTAHRAVVTELENALGIASSSDELMIRALHYGDPDSCDWNTAVLSLTNQRPVEEAYRWAIARISDSQVDVRRFAADVVLGLSFADPPFGAELAAATRPRLAVEEDSFTLAGLLGAYAECHSSGPLPEVRAHAQHPAAEVRQRVAGALRYAMPDPDALKALIELAGDPDGKVRASALDSLACSDPGGAEVLAVCAGHRDDEYEMARAHALAALALHGDDDALTQLIEQGGANEGSDLYWLAYSVSRRRGLHDTSSIT